MKLTIFVPVLPCAVLLAVFVLTFVHLLARFVPASICALANVLLVVLQARLAAVVVEGEECAIVFAVAILDFIGFLAVDMPRHPEAGEMIGGLDPLMSDRLFNLGSLDELLIVVVFQRDCRPPVVVELVDGYAGASAPSGANEILLALFEREFGSRTAKASFSIMPGLVFSARLVQCALSCQLGATEGSAARIGRSALAAFARTSLFGSLSALTKSRTAGLPFSSPCAGECRDVG